MGCDSVTPNFEAAGSDKVMTRVGARGAPRRRPRQTPCGSVDASTRPATTGSAMPATPIRSLLRALPRCTRLVFLNPGIEACVSNGRSRPWEPHKYPSKAAQDANLEMLLAWIRDYQVRTDVFSLSVHRALFDRFPGEKIELAPARPLPPSSSAPAPQRTLPSVSTSRTRKRREQGEAKAPSGRRRDASPHCSSEQRSARRGAAPRRRGSAGRGQQGFRHRPIFERAFHPREARAE